MDKVTCQNCNTEVELNDEGNCPECGKPVNNASKSVDRSEIPNEDSAGKETKPEKTLDLSYAKSLGLVIPDDQLAKTIAAKFVSPDTIFHYIYLWGNPEQTDLEQEYFTKSTNFWDDVIKNNQRALTWDHAQDKSMKASPIIGKTFEYGDDDIGRWALSHLDRAHVYRKAVDALIEAGVVGTSSDSVSQYIERQPIGKSTWLKTWPWFASALTDTPCEHRMVGTVEHFKSLGVEFQIPEVPDEQVRAMVENAHRIFNFNRVFGE